jgi:hypothetical protein
VLTVPGTPGTPTFSNIAETTLTVSWTAPTGGAASYKLERCTGSGCTNFAQIATPTGTSYNDSGLTGNTTYRYRVRGSNTTGDGAYSGIGEVTTLACLPPPGGDYTVIRNCSFPGAVNGVDAGNLTISSGVTFTINAGQNIAWNNGYSVNVNGTMAINATGQLIQTNLWMLDADADGWPATTTQVAQDSSPGATYRRRNLMQSLVTVDCNDNSYSPGNPCP